MRSFTVQTCELLICLNWRSLLCTLAEVLWVPGSTTKAYCSILLTAGKHVSPQLGPRTEATSPWAEDQVKPGSTSNWTVSDPNWGSESVRVKVQLLVENPDLVQVWVSNKAVWPEMTQTTATLVATASAWSQLVVEAKLVSSWSQAGHWLLLLQECDILFFHWNLCTDWFSRQFKSSPPKCISLVVALTLSTLHSPNAYH
jgi:hypothetical protein